MQLTWLQTFMAVYQTGSFTKAARHLGVTQPTVTQQIRNLEQEFGRPLFERTAKGAFPTPSGSVLARDVQTSLKGLNSAIHRHFGHADEERPIRIGATAELTAARVVPAISSLVSGGLGIRLSIGASHELLPQLEEGFLDLVVSTVRPSRRGLETAPLADEELILVASPEAVEDFFPSGVDQHSIRKAPMIAYADTMPLIRLYWQTVFNSEPDCPITAVIPDLRGILAAVISSAGVSVLPKCLCSAALASGAITILIEPEIPPINTLYLAVHPGSLSDYRLSQVHSTLLKNARNWS
ncbi:MULTISPECIES: LysR family transcriptional regulator [Streptomyces]|uniref:LysR family transcriptional regulator n=1 Tax=Streptomyces TaxID=1883 RepID=UPI001CC268D1|nr:LysR family transcriptional regulator [Streptomyces venezuelae]